ncbi:hypothetical protein D9M68_699860 [compost metagenome]
MDIEDVFADAVSEFGFLPVMLALLEGPHPVAQRMQQAVHLGDLGLPLAQRMHPVCRSDELRLNHKKGRLVASQGEYGLVTFNIPRCLLSLQEMLADEYGRHPEKAHLGKYINE